MVDIFKIGQNCTGIKKEKTIITQSNQLQWPTVDVRVELSRLQPLILSRKSDRVE